VRDITIVTRTFLFHVKVLMYAVELWNKRVLTNVWTRWMKTKGRGTVAILVTYYTVI
jgi:hypothetical protein